MYVCVCVYYVYVYISYTLTVYTPQSIKHLSYILPIAQGPNPYLNQIVTRNSYSSTIFVP